MGAREWNVLVLMRNVHYRHLNIWLVLFGEV